MAHLGSTFGLLQQGFKNHLLDILHLGVRVPVLLALCHHLLVRIIFVIVVLTLNFNLCSTIKTLFGMDKDVVWDMTLAAVLTALRGFAKSFPWQLLMT
jgi:hypothetical protein